LPSNYSPTARFALAKPDTQTLAADGLLAAKIRSGQENEREGEREFDRGLAVQDAPPEVKKPPLFKVFLLNDDYTTQDFVCFVLQRFFGMDNDMAMRVMLSVHTQGKGICGVFTKDIAETKVLQVIEFSRHHQHPLMCTMEEA
jgi:ATP-dependent Clp protease adaptor protein ClpS